MDIPLKQQLREALAQVIQNTLAVEISVSAIKFDRPPETVEGDLAFACFPLAKLARKAPQQIAAELAPQCGTLPGIAAAAAAGGYLNLTLQTSHWFAAAVRHLLTEEQPERATTAPQRIVIEYSSPNTNKPQHLGHVRNNVLGESLAALLAACGHEVKRVNLINDRGIHICRSMLAWQKLGDGETPAGSDEKGDHLVGRYYVAFSRELERERQAYLEAKNLVPAELSEEETATVEKEFLAQSTWQQAAVQMLQRWEQGDSDVRELWQTMNDWVYAGFEETYARYGIEFDRLYYESDTYLLGRSVIEQALADGLVERRQDGSVWISLPEAELEDKLLLRSNGTSVYITQDVGTALQRYDDYSFDRQLYIVGNEQRYHFRVLFAILKQLGHTWADNLEHVAYGMVNLPQGKLKSREGTAVDADDLLNTVKAAARRVMTESERRQDFSEQEMDEVSEQLALGAIKYYLLRVSAVQDLLYDPEQSVDLNGTTGPYLQYAHARMASLLRKSAYTCSETLEFTLESDVERELLLKLLEYSDSVRQAAESRNPSRLAQYLYELSRGFNRFWHDHPILQAESATVRDQRLALTAACRRVLQRGLGLLGIPTPERI